MADLSVTKRRIQPIQDAAAAGNWKQALQLCDKWQKKGEKSDRFLALKASILVNQPDDAHRKKGKNETLQLCHRPSAVTDIEAIYLLQSCLKRLDLEIEEGSKLWEKATAALPNDKEFLTTWLNDSLRDESWLAAQKAATALRKAAPTERQYDFLNILLCYLIHQDDRLSDKERTLFGTLAYRLVSKAAEAVPIDKNQLLTSGKAIATPEELGLLVKIYLSTGHTTEARALLNDPRFDLESKIAEQDPQMVFTMLIEILDASEDPNMVMETCQKLLTSDSQEASQYFEDDRIWRTVIRQAESSNTHIKDCMDLVDTALKRQPQCRAAMLARLSLLRQVSQSDAAKKVDLTAGCKQCIATFGDKPFCFSDVIEPLSSLDSSELNTFISELATLKITESSKALRVKLSYNATARTPEAPTLLSLATNSLDLHKSLPKRSNERSEMALLAALALVRAGIQMSEVALVLQASYILEYSCADFGDYYPSAVRLLQLQRTVGILSLCMNRFGSLSVKNLQWETVGHLLLTRVSSLHPLQCEDEEGSLDPLRALDAGVYMSRSAEKSLDDQIRKGLGYGSYMNALDSVSMKRSIKRSLNRHLYKVEERRIKSLIGSSDAGLIQVPPAPLVDQRDFTFLETYGVEPGCLEEFLQCGPLPREAWLNVMLMWTHIRAAIALELGDHTNDAKEALASIKALRASNSQVGQSSTSEMTEAEKSCNTCYEAIASIVLANPEATDTKQEEVDQAVTSLTSWLDGLKSADHTVVNETRFPMWDYLHLHLTQLEAIQAIASLLTLLIKRNKPKSGRKAPTAVRKEDILKIQTAAVNAKKKIHDQTWALKERLNAPGVLGKLVDIVSGRLQDGKLAEMKEYQALADVLSTVYDEVALEEYCGKMRDSWEDALDGILAIQVTFPDAE